MTLRIFQLQIICTVGLTAALSATALWSGWEVAMLRAGSFAAGAALAMLTTAITARSVLQSERAAASAPQLGLAPVFAGLLAKLAVVAAGAFVGLAVLELAAGWFLAGFGVVHFVGVGAAVRE